MKRDFHRIHGLAGLGLGLPILVVVATGTVALFEREIGEWARRGERSVSMIESDRFSFDRAVALAVAPDRPEDYGRIGVFQPGLEPVLVRLFPSDPATGLMMLARVDPESGALIDRQVHPESGLSSPAGVLSSFLVSLHVRLLVPGELGLISTGSIAFALLFVLATGVLFHRPTPTRLRGLRGGGAPRARLGRFHAFVGSWTLLFTGVLAATGVYLSFATTVLVPVLALIASEENPDRLVEPELDSIEVQPKPGTASIDAIVADALARHPGAELTRVQIDAWRQEQAKVYVGLEAEGLFERVQRGLVYDGQDGTLIATPPVIGTRPSMSSAAFDLAQRLHFGTVFGWSTRILWAVLGLATVGLVMSGFVVSALRSPRSDSVRNALAATSTGGLLCGFAAVGWVWALGVGLGKNPEPMLGYAFFGAMLGIGMVGVGQPLLATMRRSMTMAGIAIALLPLANGWAVGLSSRPLFDPSLGETVLVDLALWVFGASVVGFAQRGLRTPGSGIAARAEVGGVRRTIESR